MTRQPVYMLNALWFRPGGAALYEQYARAAGPVVSRLGGRQLEAYHGVAALLGDWQPDLLFVVEWPSWEQFLRLADDPEYQQIAHLREPGLERSILLRCDRVRH